MPKHVACLLMLSAVLGPTTRPMPAGAQEQPLPRVEAWSGFIGDEALPKLPDPAKLLLDRKAFGLQLVEDGAGKELPFKIGVIRDAKAFAAVARSTEGYLPFEKGAKPIWPRWKDVIDWQKEAVVYVVLTNHSNYLRFHSWKVDDKGVGRLQVNWDGILPRYVEYQACLFCRVPRDGLNRIAVFIEDKKTAELSMAEKAEKSEK